MAGSRGIAIFDMDRTLTRGGSFSPFLLLIAGETPEKILYVFAVLFQMLLYVLGIKTRKALKEYMLAAFMTKMGRTDVDKFAKIFVKRLEDKGKFFKDGMAAIARHKKQGHRIVIATASMDFYVAAIANKLGADDVIATTSIWRKGVIEPFIKGENCYGPEKAKRIQAFLAGKKTGEVWFYSDHHSDGPSFELADKRVAVNPNARLKQMAKARGYDIQYWR